MISVINFTHKSTAYLEPHTSEMIVGLLKMEGVSARLFCTSINQPELDDFNIFLNDKAIIFYGLINVRGILDEDQDRKYAFVNSLRKNGYKGTIIFGGQFASLNPERVLEKCEGIDYVIIGDPDGVVPDIIKSLDDKGKIKKLNGLVWRSEKGRIESSPRQTVSKLLNKAPVHRPYLEAMCRKFPSGYLASIIEASRGCYHPGCTFCSTPEFNRTMKAPPFRMKSIDTLIDEMSEVYKSYGVKKFIFEDDSFCSPGKSGIVRLEEFAEKLNKLEFTPEFSMILRADFVNHQSISIYKKLKEKGLMLVYFGVESFHKKDLEFYQKGISIDQTLEGIELLYQIGYKMDVSSERRLKPGLLPFHPYTELKTIEEQLIYLKQYSITPIKMLARVELYPGTPLFKLAEKDNLLVADSRAGFRFQNKNTEIFHTNAVEVLRSIYKIRKEIRNIEKTVMGFRMGREYSENVENIRLKLEKYFENYFIESLKITQRGFSMEECIELQRIYCSLVKELIKNEKYDEIIESSWQKILKIINHDFETKGYMLPEKTRPIYFRPCWFPVIH